VANVAASTKPHRVLVVYIDADSSRREAFASELGNIGWQLDACNDASAVSETISNQSLPAIIVVDIESIGSHARSWLQQLAESPNDAVRQSRRFAIFPSQAARASALDWPVHKQLLRRPVVEHAWELREAVLEQAMTTQLSQQSSANSAVASDGALRDGLTGLYTHGAFQERLREEVARAERYGQPMSLIIVDIDQFSAVNYDLGYSAGDDVLRRIASALSDVDAAEAVRRSDIAARHSGGEFVLLLPETRKAGALTRAGRLRDNIAAMEMPGGRAIGVSMGVACFPDDAADSDSLLAAAEAALRGAKRAAGPSSNNATAGGRIHFFAANADAAASDTTGTGPIRTFERPQDGRNPRTLATAVQQAIVDRFRPYHDRMGEVTGMLQRDRAISCLLLDLTRLRQVELDLGIAHHTEIYDRAANVLDAMRGTLLSDTDLICRTGDGDGYLVFLTNRAPAHAPRLDLEKLALAVEDAVEESLAPAARELLREQPRITVGSARVLGNSMLRPERLITRLVTDAGTSARIARERSLQRHKAALQDIILGDGLTSVYQPIVDLRTSDIFAFEALTRGPKKTAMESPVTLFGVADEVDLTFELDRACFRGALRNAVGLPPVHRLFVNLLPMSFYDASFIELEVSNLLTAAGLTPANIVFEITEKLAIENFASFRRALATYTAMGFGVAIDDVGTRHSNLETVMALRPHFIKISDVLVRGIARSPVKREMMRSLGRIADAIDAVVVAEGIETPDDLAVLRDLGLRYGQGYFMARPGPPFPELLPGVRETIEEISGAHSVHRASASEQLQSISDDQDADDDGNDDEASDVIADVRVAAARTSAQGSTPPPTMASAVGSNPQLPLGQNPFRDDEITNDFAKPVNASPQWTHDSAVDFDRPTERVRSKVRQMAISSEQSPPWQPLTTSIGSRGNDKPSLLQTLQHGDHAVSESDASSDSADSELPPFEDTRA
jgi:diguanylate cyclase (GGDEF)-like protein